MMGRNRLVGLQKTLCDVVRRYRNQQNKKLKPELTKKRRGGYCSLGIAPKSSYSG